ncbi:MAG: hypothetical protein OXE43_13905 [Chloroflexi bacterium]|nr:hypothetical protein [Chloroflexota bacterium]
MTTATTSVPFTATAGPQPSLEALVDRLVESIFRSTDDEPGQSLARSVHDARRLRHAGDLDGALALLAGVDMAAAEPHEARWAYNEWLDLARRRCREGRALVYSPDLGRAAVLDPRGDGSTLEVLATLGMRWRPGKTVSRRSLRGLRPLVKGGSQ